MYVTGEYLTDIFEVILMCCWQNTLSHILHNLIHLIPSSEFPLQTKLLHFISLKFNQIPFTNMCIFISPTCLFFLWNARFYTSSCDFSYDSFKIFTFFLHELSRAEFAHMYSWMKIIQMHPWCLLEYEEQEFACSPLLWLFIIRITSHLSNALHIV